MSDPQWGDERLPEKFWRNVEVSQDGCWRWTKGLNHAGYARFPVVSEGRRQHRRIHRLTYEVFVAPLTPGLTIDHLCRVRNCCNPAHLEEVTQRENTLRGDTLNAANVLKTHCPQGHPYSADNTYVNRGRRNCRICSRASARDSHARKVQDPIWMERKREYRRAYVEKNRDRIIEARRQRRRLRKANGDGPLSETA